MTIDYLYDYFYGYWAFICTVIWTFIMNLYYSDELDEYGYGDSYTHLDEHSYEHLYGYLYKQ